MIYLQFGTFVCKDFFILVLGGLIGADGIRRDYEQQQPPPENLAYGCVGRLLEIPLIALLYQR